jgi:hypothetical protein
MVLATKVTKVWLIERSKMILIKTNNVIWTWSMTKKTSINMRSTMGNKIGKMKVRINGTRSIKVEGSLKSVNLQKVKVWMKLKI